MDPIHPISPGPPAISRGSVPVERLERITRERDRRHKDELARDGRRAPARQPVPEEERPDHPPTEGDGPHIDVRA
jgi:hypothetical protein